MRPRNLITYAVWILYAFTSTVVPCGFMEKQKCDEWYKEWIVSVRIQHPQINLPVVLFLDNYVILFTGLFIE